jgi:small-conductance mechanosensitive channel
MSWQHLILFLEKYQWNQNSLKDFLQALIIFFVLLAVLKVFQKIILSRLAKLAQKTKTDIDDTLIKIIKSIKPPFYFFLAFYVASQSLILTAFFQKAINIVLSIWIVYQIIIALQIFINYLIEKILQREKEKSSQQALKLIGKIARGVLWVLGILLILSNLGINITSLIAGLGIGGVAIALALQNILGDLFSSFAIYFDKPFVVGDYIVVGNHSGIVKNIGIKTTRLQALQGEEIVLSNNELTSTRVQNFKKLKERRIVFNFGVVYQTSLEKLKEINNLISSIIKKQSLTRFDRCHFIQFDDSALSFEVVYYVKSPDFAQYREIHQKILFEIKTAFEKEKISMAYPTQTIYLTK